MWLEKHYNRLIGERNLNLGLPLAELLRSGVVRAAAGLIGCVLARQRPDGCVVRARIVETEAYHQSEPVCHAYRGQTPRNAVMFGPPGRLYVYFTYGMWHCANVVCEPEGTAAAVLLRALAPLPPHDGSVDGAPALRLSGPGLLCRGLELTTAHNGANLLQRGGEVWLYRPRDWSAPPLSWTKRVGFSFESELKWRCCWDGHPGLSPGRPGALVSRKKERGR